MLWRKETTNQRMCECVCLWVEEECVCGEEVEREKTRGGERKKTRGGKGETCVCMRRGGERYERYTRVEKSSGEGVYDVRDACQGACVMRY